MKKVLIIGAKGMLGQELVRVFLADENYEVIAWDRKEIDITDETQVKDKIGALAPEIIINAAAYNAVDKAEEPAEFELAKKLNGLAPGYLAKVAKGIKIPPACQRLSVAMAGRPNPPFTKWGKGALFVHYSTDYVFDGAKKEGYLEKDKPSPICNYGFSKLMGEQAVARVGGQYYIIRLQKLFGRSVAEIVRPFGSQSLIGQETQLRRGQNLTTDNIGTGKKSFFDVMLELAKTKKELEVVDEELANFTYAPDLAARTKWLVDSSTRVVGARPAKAGRQGIKNISPERSHAVGGASRRLYPFGVYHITNEGAPATWYGAAKILFEMAQQRQAEFISASGSRNEFGMTKYEDIKLIPVSGENFPRPAKRPNHSILLNSKLPPLRPWPEALREYLSNYLDLRNPVSLPPLLR